MHGDTKVYKKLLLGDTFLERAYIKMRKTPDNEFWIDSNNEIRYNSICEKCELDCKQSYRATLIQCPIKKTKKKKTDALDYMATEEE